MAIAGVGLGLTALGLIGGFAAFTSRSLLGAGRTLGSIETDVKATKVDVSELKTTVKDGQNRNDTDHDKIYGRVNDQGYNFVWHVVDFTSQITTGIRMRFERHYLPDMDYILANDIYEIELHGIIAVSYTHLTLPTILLV